MTLAQPEATARKKTDTTALMKLSLAAIATRHEELLAQDREDDERAVRHAETTARAMFGQDTADALGDWLPSPDMPEGTYEAFVELLPLTNLICTVPRDLSLPTLKVLSYCGSCSSHSTTVITSLADLAGALRRAGAR
ncbi:hypothetical protein ACFY9Y_22290 [Streptomyces fimicarius]|uniref:hypothetical protein n=1 Tax=Streptomyces griseus TaxID=1911 RepID=UPI0036E27D4C